MKAKIKVLKLAKKQRKVVYCTQSRGERKSKAREGLNQREFFLARTSKVIYHAADAVFEKSLIEIDHQAKPEIKDTEIGEQHLEFDRRNGLNGFQFNDNLSFNDQVGPESDPHFLVIPEYRNSFLPFHKNILFPKLIIHYFFINLFQQTGAKFFVDVERSVDDNFCNFIFMHSSGD